MKHLAGLVALLGLALAADFSGSLAVETRAVYVSGLFTMEATYAASLLASEHRGDAYLETALYPSWSLDRSHFEPGLSRLEVGCGNGRYAFGLGAGPEPLATLRLINPLSLVSETGDYAPALWGGWGELYPNPGTRLRLALRYLSGNLLGVFRADGRFSSVDYQLTLVYGRDPNPTALGTGFSLSVGDMLTYGEVWRLLDDPNPWRGGLGANFYLYDGLASVEAAYTGGWQLALAYDLQAGEYWAVDSMLIYEVETGRQTGSLRFTYLGDAGDVTLSLALNHDGSTGLTWLPGLSARVYY